MDEIDYTDPFIIHYIGIKIDSGQQKSLIYMIVYDTVYHAILYGYTDTVNHEHLSGVKFILHNCFGTAFVILRIRNIRIEIAGIHKGALHVNA